MQINTTQWIKVNEIEKIRKNHPYLSISLQISQYLMKGLNLTELVEHIQLYKDYINYILIDPSRGKGIEMNTSFSTSIYKLIKEKAPKLNIVFAGGLYGENIGTILKDIINEIGSRDFSIDAEGSLRNKNSEIFGDDILNIQKVEEYLINAKIQLIPDFS